MPATQNVEALFVFRSGITREFWKDLFLAVTVFDTFDSRPPNPEAARNDFGLVASIGWSY